MDTAGSFNSAQSIINIKLIIGMFLSFWLGCIGVMLLFECFRGVVHKELNSPSAAKVAALHHADHEKLTFERERNGRSRLREYMLSYIPHVFSDDLWGSRLATEIVTNHPVVAMFDTERSRYDRWMSLFQYLTQFSYSCFMMAFLYNMQYPSDDGSCRLLHAKVQCLSVKSYLDSSVSQCSWRDASGFNMTTIHSIHNSSTPAAVAGYCEWNTPVFSPEMYVLMTVIVAVFMIPLQVVIDSLFGGIVLAPTKSVLSSHDKDSHSVKALVSGAARMGNAAVAGARRMSQQLKAKILRTPSKIGVLSKTVKVPDYLRSWRKDAIEVVSAIPDVANRLHLIHDDALTELTEKEDASDGVKDEEQGGHGSGGGADNRAHPSFVSSSKNVCQSESSQEVIAALNQYRGFIAGDPEQILQFDEMWSNYLKIKKQSMGAKFHVDDDALKEIQDRLNEVNQEVTQNFDDIQSLPPTAAGAQLMKLFVLDLIGRDSSQARILNHKLLASDTVTDTRVVSWGLKCATITGLALCNLGFFFMCLVYANAKSYDWQKAWVINCLLNVAIDIFVNNIFEAAMLHFVVPSTISTEARAVKTTLKGVVDNIFKRTDEEPAHPFSGEIEVIQAPKFSEVDYFFVSTRIAKKLPDLLESQLVLSFRSPLPMQINKATSVSSGCRRQHLDALGNVLKQVGSLLRMIGILSPPVQRIIIHVVQPLIVGTFGILLVVMAKNVIAASVVSVLVFIILAYAAVEYILERKHHAVINRSK